MKYLIRMLICFTLTGQIISCSTKQPKQISSSTTKEVQLDSNAVLTLIEPYDNCGIDSLATVVRLLGLKDIESEPGSKEIRIWFEYALSDSGKLFVLKNEKNVWFSFAYFYKYNRDGHNKIVSITKKIEKNEPNFLAYLFKEVK